ncbi:MAG: BON domain-containing protein [Myxococcota bacterium]
MPEAWAIAANLIESSSCSPTLGCGITNLTTISKSQRGRDSRVASRLQRDVEAVERKSSVRVTVFGKVAVLTGNVTSLRAKRHLERVVGVHDCIGRVINKVAVEVSV